jgi:FKBP-type peptidyl-prolyl cis-trans isomerase SlyD
MDKPQNRFISVHYQLYTVEGEERKLEEQTSREHPFDFISGFGIALDGFEQKLLTLEKGTPFDFTLTPAEGFGPYDPTAVHKVGREVFMINNHFDHENVFPGAVITLLDEEEHRIFARILDIDSEGVTLDTNHPLAGKTLNFTGLLLENRDATLEEIQSVLNQMSGDGCDCAQCGHHEHTESCGHHHDHGDGCGCGCGCHH